MQKKLFIGQDLMISLRKWFSIVNYVYNTHNPNTSRSLPCLWDRRFHYILWTKLATDLFHFEGSSYLLIVDYTSRFPVVHKLSSMTGQHVANQCKQVFSEYIWPETLISDSGPCYTVNAFTSVMNPYHIISQDHPTTHNLIDLLRSMYRL